MLFDSFKSVTLGTGRTGQAITKIIQWGTEIGTSLDFEWSKRGCVVNGLVFKSDLKSGSPTI